MSPSEEAWQRFDDLIASASTETSPWTHDHGATSFGPDLDLLARLLSVPIELGLNTQSGIPAKAVDVWIAHELRRAGFGDDEVWPRPARPRVLPREVALLLDQLPRELRTAVGKRLTEGRVSKAVSADASILGRAYYKQVDVVISQWARGPELLISTKRMDSSLANNAFNRIEESYGDAHNLRGRHPLAAIGYILVLRQRALDQSPAAAERLIDLVAKLGQGDGGYTATCALVVEWEGDGTVEIVPDRVPESLGVGPFLRSMVSTVLDNTPVDTHVRARELLLGRSLEVNEEN